MKTVALFLTIVALFLASCAQKSYTTKAKTESKPKTSQKTTYKSSDPANRNDQLTEIKKAEKAAATEGRAILEIGRKMALEEKAIVKGSCWNWVNTVFKRAGYGTDKHIAFKSKKTGPYVKTDQIQAGDWIYYINHSYGGVEHSGIFVYWVDKKKKIGVTLSYGGEHRKEPGRYRQYNLKDVYYITRAGKK